MRALVLASLLALAAGTAAAAALDLPVRRPGERRAPPCYAGDVLELRLAPAAARAVLPAGAGRTRAGRTARLGLAAIDAAAAALGASFEPEFAGEAARAPGEPGVDFTAFHVVHLPPGVRLEDALARFRALPDVASATPIAEMPLAFFPNDSLFAAEHWLYRASTPRHDLRAPEAWDVERGDTSIVVAILDTGVLRSHPDLGGTGRGPLSNLWTNRAEANGLPGVDDDGNGFVDDVWGWDFVATSIVDTLHEDDVVDADNDPNDWTGHGTMVAGLLGAISDNASGIAGVVPRVRLMPVRMGWSPRGAARPDGTVRMDFAAQAFRYATRMGASVINCSWAGIADPALDAAIAEAVRAGVVVVAASGNDGQSTYLGQRADVISVAATDSSDAYMQGAQTGPWLDVAAGGVNVTTTYLAGVSADSLLSRQPAYVSGFSGTSFAAPLASGAAALLQSQAHSRGRDPLTPLGVLLRLRETADDVRALNLSVPNVAPRLNLLRALADPPTSTSVRSGAASVGPPVVLRYNDGRTLEVIATSDRHLVAYDGATADTAWIATLPATPVGNLAGADLGAGRGVGLFVGTASGSVAGFDDAGIALPGWPVTGLGNSNFMSGGVALGDLDGDGRNEVVCMGSNGRVWAWHADGTRLAGFPFATGTIGAAAPALADLDGQPGAEIVVLDGFGVVHAVDHTGAELWQWASPGSAAAPLVGRLGRGGPLAVFVADPTGVSALDSTGTPWWTTPVAVNTVAEPALGDFDGDGADELVVATGSPTTLARIDSSGAVVTGRGWPFVTGVDPAGPLLVGPLRAGHGACVAFHDGAGVVAFDDSGHVVPAFPKPLVSAGAAPTLADVRGNGATQVVAGSNADSSMCVLDAGAGTWNAALASWPTPRGNAARTGNRAYAAAPAILDRVRPAAVTDLAGTPVSVTSLRLTWTATGDDSLAGRASRVDVRFSLLPITPANFAFAIGLLTRPPAAAGAAESLLVTGVEGTTYYFALVAYDAAGNASALSNVASAATASAPPGLVTDLRVSALADTVATLAWTATGEDGATGRPASYAIAADPSPIDSARFDSAALHANPAATVDAGGSEHATFPGLTRGRHWYFALRAIDHHGAASALSNVATIFVPVGGALRGRVGVAVAARVRPAHVPVAFDWQGAEGGGAEPQSLAIVDLAGRVLRRVPLGREPGGTWTWDGRDGDGRRVPAGLYLVRLFSGGRHADGRVVLLR